MSRLTSVVCECEEGSERHTFCQNSDIKNIRMKRQNKLSRHEARKKVEKDKRSSLLQLRG